MSPSHFLILYVLSITVQQVTSDMLSCAAAKDDAVGGARKSIVSRVVGGRNATFAPYQIFFAWTFKSEMSGCGGTILNKRFILTAAHCVDDNQGKNEVLDPKKGALIKVIVGELNWCKAIGLNITNDLFTDLSLAAPVFTQKFENVKDVSEVHMHPVSNGNYLLNDFGILKLSEDLKFIKDKIQPACLPSMFPDASFLRKTAKLSGFGGIMEDRNNTFEENPATCSLKEAQLKVMPCETLLPEDFPLNMTNNPKAWPKDWRSKKICLHHQNIFPPATACSGDSGGPLIMNEGGYSVVVGVASFLYNPTQIPTYQCSTEGVSIYAEVQAYLPWIESIIGQGAVNGVCPESFETIAGSSIAIPRGGIKIQSGLTDLKSCSTACKKERNCCSFEWSEAQQKCNLHHYCRTKPEKYRDFITCRKKGYACEEGFELTPGNVPGRGFSKMNQINSKKCGQACLSKSECCSYEFSPSYRDCNLNKECKPSQKKFQDFLFCKKLGK